MKKILLLIMCIESLIAGEFKLIEVKQTMIPNFNIPQCPTFKTLSSGIDYDKEDNKHITMSGNKICISGSLIFLLDISLKYELSNIDRYMKENNLNKVDAIYALYDKYSNEALSKIIGINSSKRSEIFDKISTYNIDKILHKK